MGCSIIPTRQNLKELVGNGLLSQHHVPGTVFPCSWHSQDNVLPTCNLFLTLFTLGAVHPVPAIAARLSWQSWEAWDGAIGPAESGTGKLPSSQANQHGPRGPHLWEHGMVSGGFSGYWGGLGKAALRYGDCKQVWVTLSGRENILLQSQIHSPAGPGEKDQNPWARQGLSVSHHP